MVVRVSPRLYPLLTMVTNQQLPLVYDKPMIDYPLATFMLAGIKAILIISTPEDMLHFEKLLGDVSWFGVSLSNCVQPFLDGLSQTFLLGENSLVAKAVLWCRMTASSMKSFFKDSVSGC